MVQREKNFDQMSQVQQDRVMRQHAGEWLNGCSIWHFVRVTERDVPLSEGMLGVWFVLADGTPPQTSGLLLCAYNARWEVLADKTAQPLGHSSKIIQDRLGLLLAELKQQSGVPIWRSDHMDDI